MAIHSNDHVSYEALKADLKKGPVSQRWWYRLLFAWWR